MTVPVAVAGNCCRSLGSVSWTTELLLLLPPACPQRRQRDAAAAAAVTAEIEVEDELIRFESAAGWLSGGRGKRDGQTGRQTGRQI